MEVDEYFYNSFAHDDLIPKTQQYHEFEYCREQLTAANFIEQYNHLTSTTFQHEWAFFSPLG